MLKFTPPTAVHPLEPIRPCPPVPKSVNPPVPADGHTLLSSGVHPVPVHVSIGGRSPVDIFYPLLGTSPSRWMPTLIVRCTSTSGVRLRLSKEESPPVTKSGHSCLIVNTYLYLQVYVQVYLKVYGQLYLKVYATDLSPPIGCC